MCLSAVMPFTVGSNWHGYIVYDHCWKGADSYEHYHTITWHPSDNVYKVQQVGHKLVHRLSALNIRKFNWLNSDVLFNLVLLVV